MQKIFVMNENAISKIIVDASLCVHRSLGPGLLEKVYQECLCYELKQRGLFVEKEKSMPVVYNELIIENAYRIDLLVEKKVVVELKSVAELADVHLAQTLTYLKLGGCKLGLLINFNVPYLKMGIRRVVNGL